MVIIISHLESPNAVVFKNEGGKIALSEIMTARQL